jgi:hypothetical protein
MIRVREGAKPGLQLAPNARGFGRGLGLIVGWKLRARAHLFFPYHCLGEQIPAFGELCERPRLILLPKALHASVYDKSSSGRLFAFQGSFHRVEG